MDYTPRSAQIPLDEFDRRILRSLQDCADKSMEDVSESVGLSRTPCWRRVKRLEETGIIVKRVTLLARRSLGLGVKAFVCIKLKSHGAEVLFRFETMMQDIEEVVECYAVAGDDDYVLQVVAFDLWEYENILRNRIARLPEVNTTTSFITLKEIKYTTKLPLPQR